MDPVHHTLLLLIESYELHPSERRALALKEFLSTASLGGSPELQQALTEARRLLDDWEDLDQEWYHLVQSFIT